MKILFFGDSITDAGRNRDNLNAISAYGYGFVRVVADRLISENPSGVSIMNRGISGNRVVDLYARIKKDCWNLEPDVIGILIGVNDIWHEVEGKNGVDLVRFEKVYRMIIEDTLKVLPNVKIVLSEPFVLLGACTQPTEENPNRYKQFCEVYEYAKVVEKLAKEYGLYFLPLQEKFNECAEKYDASLYLSDGVHPNIAGANLIATEWIKLYKDKIENA